MNSTYGFTYISILLIVSLIYFATFIVHESELALRLRLGEIIPAEDKPGLHIMIPIIDSVIRFDKRIQTLDSNPERFLTKEKKDVIVDFYAKWRINNAAQYYRSTGGNIAMTERLLIERINTSLRDEFGNRTIKQVVSGERKQIMDLMTKEMSRKGKEIGVEIVDIRVKRIDLPPEVSESVYERMRAERERVARELRGEGSEKAEGIRADADRDRTVILANAYKESQQLRGEGDAKAASIYAKAYQQDPEFYSFYRSIQAYRAAFQGTKNTLVLQPDSEFFQFFKGYKGHQTQQ